MGKKAQRILGLLDGQTKMFPPAECLDTFRANLVSIIDFSTLGKQKMDSTLSRVSGISTDYPITTTVTIGKGRD